MGDKQVQLNMQVLKRLGYWIAEAVPDEFDPDVALWLLDSDCFIEDRVYPKYYESQYEGQEDYYDSLEEYVYDFGPSYVTNIFNARKLLEGLRWAVDHYPNRAIGKPYQVYIYGDEIGFEEADTLEEAICAAWLDYMERKDRREQKRGTHEAD